MAMVCAVAGADAIAVGDPFVQEVRGVVVDWRQGTLTARGVAAADWRMPSAEVARAGAERRARSEGRSRLAEALRALPLGGGRRLEPAAIARALERARAGHVDYQSNGGVTLQVEIAFGDWDDGPAPPGAPDAGLLVERGPLAFRLAEGSLAAAPLLVIGQREIALGRVRYAPPGEVEEGVHPLAVHADKQGRLVADDGLTPEEVAHRRVVIYVRNVLR